MSVVDAFLAERHTPPTVHFAVQTYIRGQQHKGLSPHTLTRIYYNLKPLLDAWQQRPFCEMDRTWLRQFVADQWTTYAPDTMRTRISDLRAFCKWAKKKRHHDRNLAKRIQPVRRKHHRNKRATAVPEIDIRRTFTHLRNIVTTAVYRDLFGNLQHDNLNRAQTRAVRDLFILAFLYETGARVGELTRLGANAMNATTAVRQQVYHITMYGKTADRDRHFTHHTAELWHLWQSVRPDDAYTDRAIVGWSRRTPTRPLAASAISAIILRRSAAAGVRPFRANALRHAKAKRTRKIAGLEMARILLDHSSIETTRGYANIESSEVDDIVSRTGLSQPLF